MTDRGGGFSVILAGAGLGLCCALPVLLASGGIGAVAAWFTEGSLGWMLLAAFPAIAAGALILRRRRRVRRSEPPPETERAGARGATAGRRPSGERTSRRIGLLALVILLSAGLVLFRSPGRIAGAEESAVDRTVLLDRGRELLIPPEDRPTAPPFSLQTVSYADGSPTPYADLAAVTEALLQ